MNVEFRGDQDPIFDHANGVKVTSGASAPVFTPGAACKYALFQSSGDVFIRTDDVAAADAAGSVLIVAGLPVIYPVTPGVPVRAFGAGPTLRIIPLKAR
jgi:hypothetical protein